MTRKKSLFVSPVGGDAKGIVGKIIERFGHTSFDFLLLVYDDSRYDESPFASCKVIYDKSPLFWQVKRHVTPDLCRKYEYVFVWMDDLDILDFDPQNFLQIVRANKIEVAHPSLSADSVISHPVMQHESNTVGRYTDFVEQMAFVFKGDRWSRFWELIIGDQNPWGWGYDEVAYSYCRFRRMAVIDAEVIKHLRRGGYQERARVDRQMLQRKLKRFHFSRKKTLCHIATGSTTKSLVASAHLGLHYVLMRLYVLLGAGYIR
jgi:Protein of unknown function (DUF707)